jgi:hypothetical protein
LALLNAVSHGESTSATPRARSPTAGVPRGRRSTGLERPIPGPHQPRPMTDPPLRDPPRPDDRFFCNAVFALCDLVGFGPLRRFPRRVTHQPARSERTVRDHSDLLLAADGTSLALLRGRSGSSDPASRRSGSNRSFRRRARAFWNCHANIAEARMHLALPARTTSSGASIVSSMGVS